MTLHTKYTRRRQNDFNVSTYADQAWPRGPREVQQDLDPVRRHLQHRPAAGRAAQAREVLRLTQKMQVAHTFLWECSYKGLKLAQLLGQLGVALTHSSCQRAKPGPPL